LGASTIAASMARRTCMAKENQDDSIFKDPHVQVLVGKFLSGEIDMLKPCFDPETGYRYPIIEAIVGESKTEFFLNKLYEANVLERKLYDKVIHCPECGSSLISFRYNCPFCGSFDISKSALVEHVKCGYMGVETNFFREGRLFCPKCQVPLLKEGVDYRKAGVWCTCNSCKKSFDIPASENFCRSCCFTFNFENAEITDVYSYTLRPSVSKDYTARWMLIGPLREFLAAHGLRVSGPTTLKGRSGAAHVFDLVAFKGEVSDKAYVFDLASSENEVSEQSVIALFAKVFDVSPSRAYLIAIPGLSENGKKMAELYNIRTVEAKNLKDALWLLEQKLDV
jgi:hypothetical protein